MKSNNFSHEIEAYTNALLEPSMTKAIDVSKKFIQEDKDIKLFWENIIVPTMHDIGKRWANNEITVGEEHTATSISQRVMAEYYERILNTNEESKRKILVTISPKELHQIGARMVADLLELNGYDVDFLGSNVRIEEILDTIVTNNIKEIIISTTLVSSLNSTEELILEIKSILKDKIKIYVGGQAYTSSLDIKTNADKYIADVNSLLSELKRE